MQLVKPSVDYKKSYRSLIAGFVEKNETLVPFILKEDHSDFEAMVCRLDDYSKGIDIPDHFVPHNTYWLIDEMNEVVGVVNVRQYLTERLRQIGGHIGFGIKPSQRRKGYGTCMLELTLLKLNEIGLDEVLLTCDRSNIASRKVILANSGVFESEVYFDQMGDYVQRFKIKI